MNAFENFYKTCSIRTFKNSRSIWMKWAPWNCRSLYIGSLLRAKRWNRSVPTCWATWVGCRARWANRSKTLMWFVDLDILGQDSDWFCFLDFTGADNDAERNVNDASALYHEHGGWSLLGGGDFGDWNSGLGRFRSRYRHVRQWRAGQQDGDCGSHQGPTEPLFQARVRNHWFA